MAVKFIAVRWTEAEHKLAICTVLHLQDREYDLFWKIKPKTGNGERWQLISMLQNYIAQFELLNVNLLSYWNVWDLIIIDA